MNKQIKKSIQIVALSILTLFSFSALATSFPKTPAELESKTPADFKALPDVKVTLGKAISPKDLAGKTETELALMRNSIYAQASFKFSEPWLHQYFLSRSWYKEGKFTPSTLTPVDHQNVTTIYDFQKKHNLLSAYKAPAKPAVTMKPVAKRTTAAAVKEYLPKEKELKKLALNMHYCDYFNKDGAMIGYFVFHRNGKATLSQNAMTESGEVMESAYGYEDFTAYSEDGNSYEMKTAIVGKGKWAIPGVRIWVTLDNGEVAKLHFGPDGFRQHRCFETAAGIF